MSNGPFIPIWGWSDVRSETPGGVRMWRRGGHVERRDAIPDSPGLPVGPAPATPPQYYPRVERLQLLLPICLVSDENVDLALAVEKTASGNYLAHTVLPLDWAYTNARLICRPDSDWLTPTQIIEGVAPEQEP
jgi:hypothetical protein